MRSAIFAIVIVLLLPVTSVTAGAGTIGLFFTQSLGQMHYSPVPYEEFKVYVYSNGVQCKLSAAEFRLDLSHAPGINLVNYTVPIEGLVFGDPSDDFSIAYWPPLNPGSNLLCTFDLVAMSWCSEYGGPGATLVDAPILVGPSGQTGRVVYTCWPEYYMLDIIGMTSTICPASIGTQDKSWGAIKSLFGI